MEGHQGDVNLVAQPILGITFSFLENGKKNCGAESSVTFDIDSIMQGVLESVAAAGAHFRRGTLMFRLVQR